MDRETLEDWAKGRDGEFIDEKTSFGFVSGDEELIVEASSIVVETDNFSMEFPRAHYTLTLEQNGYRIDSRSTGGHVTCSDLR